MPGMPNAPSTPCADTQVIELDLRHLPAPEPMRRILESLDSLQEGQCLLARTPCWPQPLLDRLQGNGWRVSATVSSAGDALVRISPGDAAGA